MEQEQQHSNNFIIIFMQQMQVFKSLRNPMNSISKNLVIVIHSHSHMYLVI